MEFFASAITTLQTLVVALGAGLGVWGVVNLLEGYGSDNPGSKSQGMKQLMAGGGIILPVSYTHLAPPLSTFSPQSARPALSADGPGALAAYPPPALSCPCLLYTSRCV